MTQTMNAMLTLAEANVVHCDLKPENILLKNISSPTIKIVDFGSACLEHRTIYTYIQSRFYRSPEVILGVNYGKAIDMWSVGCIAAELFLGLPLFPGSNEFNQLYRICKMISHPPAHMLRRGKQTSKFFEITTSLPPNHRPDLMIIPDRTIRSSKAGVSGPSKFFVMKSYQQYCREQNVKYSKPKKYFNFDNLKDIIMHYPYKTGLSEAELASEESVRLCFYDFLRGILQIDPSKRWSARQASHHPFLTNKSWDGQPYQPPADPLYPLLRRTSTASTSSNPSQPSDTEKIPPSSTS